MIWMGRVPLSEAALLSHYHISMLGDSHPVLSKQDDGPHERLEPSDE
jgi:hypothetical protein